MHTIQTRMQCSDVLFATIEAMRGNLPLADFIGYALSVGVGHLQEEVLIQQRQNIYELLGVGTQHHRHALELLELKRIEPTAPVVAFGQDITARPTVRS